ncbi:unnamed protein product [Tenebrio molitor]|nr:unnamed protein product [Tenebrio molitor]
MGPTKDSVENKVNLAKLSLEELEELYERQNNILKNKKIVQHLPDKGKQLQQKLETVEKEIELRKDVKKLEKSMKALAIGSLNEEIAKENHVQHMCSIEKSPTKDRYKPFSTLQKEDKTKSEKPTQLIPLRESITLLTEQANKLTIEKARINIEELEEEHVEL